MTTPAERARRGASITVEQLSTGYWRGVVTVRIPGLPDQQMENDLFHDAGEALDWARLMIETTVSYASAR